MDDGSPVNREIHAGFCERLSVKFRRSTHQGNGFALWMKRLEKARFQWPTTLPMDVIDLTAQQVNWLFDGYDLTLLQGHATLPHHTVL